MNARMAYLELLNGNKIRFGDWLPESYLSMDESGIIRTQDGSRYRISLSENDRYEIYTEPKRKVRYAPVVYRECGHLMLSGALFSNEAEAQRQYGKDFVTMAWDNAVEVEE